MLPDYVLSPLILQWLIWPVVRPLFWFFGRFEVRGLENIANLPKGAIFASNHTGELDAVLIPAALPFFSRFRPFFYTSRERAFYDNVGWRQFFYGGFLFKLLGAYPIQPGKHDYALSLATHIRIARNKQSVIIFPEGRVGKENAFLEARGGVAYLSHATKLPVIPILISGTYGMSLNTFLRRRHRITVTFGKPLYVSALFPHGVSNTVETENVYKKAATLVMDSIRDLFSPALPEAKAVTPPIFGHGKRQNA